MTSYAHESSSGCCMHILLFLHKSHYWTQLDLKAFFPSWKWEKCWDVLCCVWAKKEWFTSDFLLMLCKSWVHIAISAWLTPMWMMMMMRAVNTSRKHKSIPVCYTPHFWSCHCRLEGAPKNIQKTILIRNFHSFFHLLCCCILWTLFFPSFLLFDCCLSLSSCNLPPKRKIREKVSILTTTWIVRVSWNWTHELTWSGRNENWTEKEKSLDCLALFLW